MHANPLGPVSANTAECGADKGIIPYLQRTEIFRDYHKAFEAATQLPLTLRPAGAFQSPLAGSKRVNGFCSLMARANKTCARCLQFQQQLETEAKTTAKSLECFAGLTESAIPIRSGHSLLGYLQTGQVFLQQPSRSRFKQIAASLAESGGPVSAAQLEDAYFSTPVVPRKQYASFIHLLGVFSQHLAALSPQTIDREAPNEMPAIAKARAFIAAQQRERISLADVARAANMSAFYFCKVFRKTTGLTFTDFLARVRVDTIKKLLLNPHARMTETAFSSGFRSLSQFNRVFHRIVGEPPSVYHRRLHRNAGEGINTRTLSNVA